MRQVGVLTSPAAAMSPMMIEKNTPIESTCEADAAVEVIPEPTPRRQAGELFITAARLGEMKSPVETPLSANSTANTE